MKRSGIKQAVGRLVMVPLCLSVWMGTAQAEENAQDFYFRGIYETDADNHETSLKWYTQSAGMGYAPAAFKVGQMLWEGKGTGKNVKKALYWFNRAANQDYAPAKHRLGVLYSEGVGIPRDTQKAYQWFHLAAIQGDYIAASLRDRLAEQMDKRDLFEAYQSIDRWLHRRQ